MLAWITIHPCQKSCSASLDDDDDNVMMMMMMQESLTLVINDDDADDRHHHHTDKECEFEDNVDKDDEDSRFQFNCSEEKL